MLRPKVSQHISSHWEHYLKAGGGFELIARCAPFPHKILSRIERWSYASPRLEALARFSEFEYEMGKLLQRLGASPSFLSFRTSCAAAVLAQHWKKTLDRFMVIGDGQGLMGAFMKWMFPGMEVFSVDLSPMLKTQRDLYGQAGLKAVFLEPVQLETIPEIDCAFNMASMQEMNPSEIARYFSFLRSRSALFYCVNREEKRLIGGEVLRFEEYPWDATDSIWIDEPCWYYTHFFSHRPPFFHRFDGPIRHRLALLHPLDVE